MNKLTQDIAGWLSISLDDAAKVQHEMAVFWVVDFSEASLGELKSIAKAAWQEIKAA